MSKVQVVYENDTVTVVETGIPGPAGPRNVIRESNGPTDLIVGAISDGQYLLRSGNTIIGAPGGGGGGGSGTVTNVAVTGSTGLTVGGSPITTSGTITLTLSDNLQSWSAILPSSKLNASAVSVFGLTLIDDADAATARATLGLGTAATTAATAYATAAQGALADTAVQPAVLSAYQAVSEKGQPGGYASLDGSGQIHQAQIPEIAITEYLGAPSNLAGMLALIGQKGDWCNRTDTGSTWVIVGDDPTQVASWAELLYPASPVMTVAGRTGNVVIFAADISDSTAAGRALLTAADAAAQRTALGLGTAATTAASAYAPAAHAASHATGGGDALAGLASSQVPNATILTESGTTRTMADSDAGNVIRCTNAAGCTVTFPDTLTVGKSGAILQAAGAGPVVWAASGSMVVTPAGTARAAHSESGGPGAMIYWFVDAANSVIISGDTA